MEAGESSAHPGRAPRTVKPPLVSFVCLFWVWVFFSCSVCLAVTWSWVCPEELVPNGIVLTAGLKVPKIYSQPQKYDFVSLVSKG